jgi:hypothetical protein
MRWTSALPALAILFAASTAYSDAPFAYSVTGDPSGYYLPKGTVRTGKFSLRDIAIGGADDFRKYLAGQRMATYAPVMIEFDDVTSPQRTDETGAPYYANAPRVLPAAFRLEGTTLTFAGDDKQLGHVTFAGKLAAYMLSAKVSPDERAAMNEAPLTGDLTVGKTTFRHVMFTWFGGD